MKFFIIIIFLSIFVSCNHQSTNIYSQPQTPQVNTEIVIPKKIREKIYTMGSVIWYEKTAVSSKVAGRVKKLYKRVGDKIIKGEKLAEIEKLQLVIEKKKLNAELIQAQAALALADAKYKKALDQVEIVLLSIDKLKNNILEKEIELKNTKRIYSNNLILFNQGGVTRESIENLHTKVWQAEINLEQAEKDLQIRSKGFTDNDLSAEGYTLNEIKNNHLNLIKNINTRIEKAEVDAAEANLKARELSIESINLFLKESIIYAPESGIIAIRNFEPGEEIQNDSPLFIIINDNKYHIQININEVDIHRVKKGQSANYELDAYPGKKFTGTIDIINPVADISSRTIECRILSTENTSYLRPGMFARCHIITGSQESALFVPESALISREKNEADLFIVKDSIAYRKQVRTGTELNDEIEIISGLEEGEEIITSGIELVRDKLKILKI